MTEDKRAILEGFGVVRPPHPPRAVRNVLSPKDTIDAISESRARHGRGREADRAHLQEMLLRDDLPQFVRSQMRRAYNRHLMREQMEEYQRVRDGKPAG